MQKKLVCGQEEIILHTHTDACYNESGSLICGMLEVVEHIHNESCLASQAVNSVLQVQSGAKSIDFSDMITGITLQVQQDGYWVDLIGDTVEENSSLRVRIDFTIEGGTLFDGNRTIHYQLPDGIRLNERESGKVDYTDGVPLGHIPLTPMGMWRLCSTRISPWTQDSAVTFSSRVRWPLWRAREAETSTSAVTAAPSLSCRRRRNWISPSLKQHI